MRKICLIGALLDEHRAEQSSQWSEVKDSVSGIFKMAASLQKACLSLGVGAARIPVRMFSSEAEKAVRGRNTVPFTQPIGDYKKSPLAPFFPSTGNPYDDIVVCLACALL